MKRLSTPEHCVDKRENAVLWNCWSLHQATLAANFLYICSMFCKFVHYPLFSIFVYFFIFLLIFLYLFVLWTAGRCIQQRLQPIVDIFALFFLYLFIIFCIFPHILYLIIIFYICLYLELLVVASSNACSRL